MTYRLQRTVVLHVDENFASDRVKVIVPAKVYLSSVFKAISDLFHGVASKQLEKETYFHYVPSFELLFSPECWNDHRSLFLADPIQDSESTLNA